MDFFRSQDIARRNTTKLVVLFALAIISLIAITNLLVIVTLGLTQANTELSLLEQIDWRLFAWISLAVVAVVGFGSLYKIMSLSGGGARVAEMMEGKLIVSGSGDLDEQVILNVVEEMAIAAGTPVPPVYLLEEEAINAFAAGYSPADAVIGITRGAIKNLSRDELQGVVAHEFSHILHGDMRLNIRLIGILHGIMVLGLMGYYLLRTSGRSRRSKNGGNIIFLAAGLMIIGYAGTFFGNLIKAAVSRQREFLADASAVQYTRNPDGIAGALKRIGGDTGSVLKNPGASEINHALFSDGVRSSFNALFATHPPLEKRIRKIQPRWDGSFAIPPRDEKNFASTAGTSQSKSTSSRADSVAGTMTAILAANAMLAHAGDPQPSDLKQARELLGALPPELHDAAHDPFSARALIYLLLLDRDETIANRQMELLHKQADPAVLAALLKLLPHRDAVSAENRLLLLNISQPALRQLSQSQYQLFRRNLLELILTDGKISLWEWVAQRVLLHQLDAVFQPASTWHHQRQKSMQQLAPECALLLLFLIRAGRQRNKDDAVVFKAAADSMGMSDLQMPAESELKMDKINVALDELVSLKALQKPAFLQACAAAISADGVATAVELEIFRALAATIDCPLPPLPQ